MPLNHVVPTALRATTSCQYRTRPLYSSITPIVSRSSITTSACMYSRWTRNSLRKLRKANLEALAQEKHLSPNGTKEELVARLLGWQGSGAERSAPSAKPVTEEKKVTVSDTSAITEKKAVEKATKGVLETTVESDKAVPDADCAPVSAELRGDESANVKDSSHPIHPAMETTNRDASQKVKVAKLMADYVDEQLPQQEKGTVDINYEESQTDETLVPENWIKAFEIKVHNRGHRAISNKAQMTFGARSAKPAPSSSSWSPPTAPADEEMTLPDIEFDDEFNRQWVNAFDKKVNQRGSRRVLELLSQDVGSEIVETVKEGVPSPNMANLAAACSAAAKPVKTEQPIRDKLEYGARTVLRNLWVTPISELSVSRLSSRSHNRQSTSDSSDEHTNDEHKSPTGNHFVTAALGATTLVWLVGGEDGMHRTVSKLKPTKQATSA